jgi:hypothetical protein
MLRNLERRTLALLTLALAFSASDFFDDERVQHFGLRDGLLNQL